VTDFIIKKGQKNKLLLRGKKKRRGCYFERGGGELEWGFEIGKKIFKRAIHGKARRGEH